MASIFKNGNTALITGGASGIGLALARKCHGHGMRVAIVDRNAENLSRAAKDLPGAKTFDVDVGDIKAWQRLKGDIEGSFGSKIDLLALNAGHGLKSTWTDSAYFDSIMATNLFGVIYGINTFLPVLQAASTPSTIIITGSKQGITNPPGNPAYNASKSAVKMLAEHLSYDLRDSPIAVHLLVPGWTFTGLSGGGPGSEKEKPAGAWTSEQVVEFLSEKMQKKEFYVICPDGDVTEELDRKRMLWSAGDAIYGRQPCSRWREDYKEEAAEFIEKTKI